MSSASTLQSGEVTSKQMGLVILASTLGAAIERYAFFLYGSMATLVFHALFFPESDPCVGTLPAPLTFLVEFIARPFGGTVIGHLGDRIGRKSTLVATLLLMGLSTLIIGFLPGYATIGVVAPLILVHLRLGQGLAVGGEGGISGLLAMEYGHKRNRSFWAGWPKVGMPIGLGLPTLAVNIVSSSTSLAFCPAWVGGPQAALFAKH